MCQQNDHILAFLVIDHLLKGSCQSIISRLPAAADTFELGLAGRPGWIADGQSTDLRRRQGNRQHAKLRGRAQVQVPQVSNSPPKIWPLPIRNQIRQLYRGVGERAYSQTPKAKCAQSLGQYPTNRTGGYQARLHLRLLWQSSGLGFRFLLWTDSDGLRLWRIQAR